MRIPCVCASIDCGEVQAAAENIGAEMAWCVRSKRLCLRGCRCWLTGGSMDLMDWQAVKMGRPERMSSFGMVRLFRCLQKDHTLWRPEIEFALKHPEAAAGGRRRMRDERRGDGATRRRGEKR